MSDDEAAWPDDFRVARSGGFSASFNDDGTTTQEQFWTGENGIRESITTVVPPVPRGGCRVYWGSHGCHLKTGHRGQHLCGPDCEYVLPYYGWATNFYGEDVALYSVPTGLRRIVDVIASRCLHWRYKRACERLGW